MSPCPLGSVASGVWNDLHKELTSAKAVGHRGGSHWFSWSCSSLCLRASALVENSLLVACEISLLIDITGTGPRLVTRMSYTLLVACEQSTQPVHGTLVAC
jgi:hypothetical protein